MSSSEKIHAHLIAEKTEKLFLKRLVTCTPRSEDEIWIVSEGNEERYKVVKVIWLYDEEYRPYDSVNIIVKLCS